MKTACAVRSEKLLYPTFLSVIFVRYTNVLVMITHRSRACLSSCPGLQQPRAAVPCRVDPHHSAEPRQLQCCVLWWCAHAVVLQRPRRLVAPAWISVVRWSNSV